MSMRTHTDIIALWPNLAAFAKDVDAPAPTVLVWRRNGRIPAYRFDAVIAAAEKRGFDGVTYRALTEALKAQAAS